MTASEVNQSVKVVFDFEDGTVTPPKLFTCQHGQFAERCEHGCHGD